MRVAISFNRDIQRYRFREGTGCRCTLLLNGDEFPDLTDVAVYRATSSHWSWTSGERNIEYKLVV